MRGKGSGGSAVAARRGLAEIELTSLVLEDCTAFRTQLDVVTAALEAALPASGRSWGRARKVVNIFLRDVVYNVDLRDHYGLAHIRPWLEIPLDSHIAKGLHTEPEGAALPRWRGLKDLTRDHSEEFQSVALTVARRQGVSRVDLDVYYWRAVELAKPSAVNDADS